ncbi:hypothetical protein GCM10027176_11710 [Actinoallomurus bryophytorum]
MFAAEAGRAADAAAAAAAAPMIAIRAMVFTMLLAVRLLMGERVQRLLAPAVQAGLTENRPAYALRKIHRAPVTRGPVRLVRISGTVGSTHVAIGAGR